MSTGDVFSPRQEEKRRWMPLALGAMVVVVVVAVMLIIGRPAKQPAAVAIDPYAEFLRLSDPKLSAATNFVGASVSYLDGKIANLGSKTVAGATVEAIFRNSMGQVVQRETLPLMLYHTGLAGFPDVAPLSAAPLTPNQTRDFRLTFEHISADWDQGYPELRFVRITTQ
ncbi:MAG: DUF2393 domain-containing protein [Acidobacteriia bacterium]|nr:DUF2393 domain-containing protein [Terriglobia bacterium]